MPLNDRERDQLVRAIASASRADYNNRALIDTQQVLELVCEFAENRPELVARTKDGFQLIYPAPQPGTHEATPNIK